MLAGIAIANFIIYKSSADIIYYFYSPDRSPKQNQSIPCKMNTPQTRAMLPEVISSTNRSPS